MTLQKPTKTNIKIYGNPKVIRVPLWDNGDLMLKILPYPWSAFIHEKCIFL